MTSQQLILPTVIPSLVPTLAAVIGILRTDFNPDGKLIRGSQYGGGLHLADYTAGTGAGGGQTELRLMDSLGTLFIKLDQAANVLETCGQNAFGESLNCTPGLDYMETHFTDKLRDGESSLDYSGARYYNSTLGRFTIPDFSDSADPIPYADLSDPQSLNLYSYAGNNPLGNSDPDGHKPCTGNDAASQPAGAGTPCDPKITAPTTTVNVHADLLDLSVLGQRVLDFAGSAVQAAHDYLNAPRDPGCMAGTAAGGAAVGSVGGGVAGGLAGGGAGTLVEPGGGTLVGGAAGAVEGASVGGQVGFSAGTAYGFIACSTGGGGGSSSGAANKQVQRGQAPKAVERVDRGRAPHEQDNVHFKDGSALNRDGSWKHGSRQLTNTEKDWLTAIGWKLP